MANPYGMVMGADGRWEYDPFEYQKSATNARFRTPFPYMGVGSLGAGLMTHSPLAGLGSEIPGIRGPGGAPAWGAQHGASPTFSQDAVSGVGSGLSDDTEALIDFDMDQLREDMMSPRASVDPNTVTASTGVPFGHTPTSGVTVSNPYGLGTDTDLSGFPSPIGFSTEIPGMPTVSQASNPLAKGLVAGMRMGASLPGLTNEEAIQHTIAASAIEQDLNAAIAAGQDVEEYAGDWAKGVDLGKRGVDIRGPQIGPVSPNTNIAPALGWVYQALTDQDLEAAKVTRAAMEYGLQEKQDVDAQVDTFSMLNTDPSRWGNLAQKYDANMRALSPYRTRVNPLANPDITVANTIAEQVAQTEATVNAMGLTGATAAAAAAAVNASQGYVTADMYAGFQEAQQAQDQAEAVAQAQAAASAAAVAASAASDPGNGWGGEDTGVTAGPAGAPQGAHHAGSNVSNIVDAVVANALAEARGRAAAEDKVNQDIMAALDDMRGGYGGWSGGDDAGMGDYGGSDTGGGGGGGYGI